MYLVLWEFIVREAARAEFERIYGPDGDWVLFFRQAAAFLGTELIQDEDVPGRYVSIDRWTSAEAYREFRQEKAVEYNALDLRCMGLTERETFLGGFLRE